MTRFRHLPPVGRLIIIAVAAGVFAIAAVACATSYNAIYRLVALLGLYSAGITTAFPLLLDVAFIVAEMAAILGGIMRAVTRSDDVTRGWPTTTMLLCGGGTVAFNVWHAALIGGLDDPLTAPRCVVASLPPVLMILSFQVLLSITKWTMLHLGRPLNSAAALSPTGAPPRGSPDPYGAPYGVAPAMYGPPGPWGAFPSQTTSQNGHPGGELDGSNGADGDTATKRALVDLYLSGLDSEQLQVATGSSIVAALAARGVTVNQREANRRLDEYKATHLPVRKQRGRA